jgi:hypothetical protein
MRNSIVVDQVKRLSRQAANVVRPCSNNSKCRPKFLDFNQQEKASSGVAVELRVFEATDV